MEKNYHKFCSDLGKAIESFDGQLLQNREGGRIGVSDEFLDSMDGVFIKYTNLPCRSTSHLKRSPSQLSPLLQSQQCSILHSLLSFRLWKNLYKRRLTLLGLLSEKMRGFSLNLIRSLRRLKRTLHRQTTDAVTSANTTKSTALLSSLIRKTQALTYLLF